jgi:hypothetical protein
MTFPEWPEAQSSLVRDEFMTCLSTIETLESVVIRN